MLKGAEHSELCQNPVPESPSYIPESLSNYAVWYGGPWARVAFNNQQVAKPRWDVAYMENTRWILKIQMKRELKYLIVYGLHMLKG